MIRRVDDLARLTDDVLARAKVPDLQTDMATWMPLPAPASASDFRRAETLVGCTLSPAITHIYSAVANGGFGPGYGLVGRLRTSCVAGDGHWLPTAWPD